MSSMFLVGAVGLVVGGGGGRRGGGGGGGRRRDVASGGGTPPYHPPPDNIGLFEGIVTAWPSELEMAFYGTNNLPAACGNNIGYPESMCTVHVFGSESEYCSSPTAVVLDPKMARLLGLKPATWDSISIIPCLSSVRLFTGWHPLTMSQTCRPSGGREVSLWASRRQPHHRP
jgi:hypothetical protein